MVRKKAATGGEEESLRVGGAGIVLGSSAIS
jgi:hypothetical protein